MKQCIILYKNYEQRLKRILLFSCMLIIAMFSSRVQALIVGADNAVSRQGVTTFPAADTNNQMLGFVFMEGGYTLQDFTTSCSYNAFFPVTNGVQMNGGNLFLLRPLELQSQIRFVSTGSFFGNGYSLHLATVQPILMPEAGINVFRLQTTFTAASAINSLDWTYDSNYIIYGRSGTATNLTALQFTGSGLTSLVTSAIATTINSVRCHPTTYYIGIGVTGTGGIPGVQVWEFNPTVNSLTQISTDAGTTSQTVASVAWHPSGDYVAYAKNVGNGQIAVYPFNKNTGALGAASVTTLGTAATFATRGSIDWSPDGNYLVAGVSNNAATELQVYLFDGANLTFTVGANIGQTVNTVSWSNTGTYIAVGLAGSTTRLRVYQHRVQNGTLTQATSVSEGTNPLSVDWRFDGNALAFGRRSGGGTEFRIYGFNTASPALTLRQSVELGTNVNEVRWSPNGKFIATGQANSQIRVYRYADGTILGQDPTIFNNIIVSFNADVVFRSPLLIQGNCIIDGNDNNMAFDSQAFMIIDSGASLLCQNVTCTTISTSKLLMTDNTSSVTLRNVNLFLDNDLTITQGYLTVQDEVYIAGPYTFGYQGSRELRINSNSRLYLDQGITFSYSPSISSNQLLRLVDSTSVLHLNNTVLRVASMGLRLTQGILNIDGSCLLLGESTNPTQGLIFGDGTSANDLTVVVQPGSGLDVGTGSLLYNNVN